MNNFGIIIETERRGNMWKGTIHRLYEYEGDAETALKILDDEHRKKAHIVELGDGWEEGDPFQHTTQNQMPGKDIEYLT